MFLMSYLLLSAIMSSLSRYYVDYVVSNDIKDNIDIRPIENDIIFGVVNIKSYIYGRPTAQIATDLFLCITLFSILFINTKQRVVSTRRFIFMQSNIINLRSISICTTIFPNPFKPCLEINKPFSIYTILLLTVGAISSCNDVMFSGHASFIVLLTFFWYDCAHRYVTMIVSIVAAFIIFIIIPATRFHYTSDVYIGVVITTSLSVIYRLFISMRNANSIFTSRIISFVKWLDYVPNTNGTNNTNITASNEIQLHIISKQYPNTNV